ncbi:hypothetical protein GCM10007320_45140 [Pseudorhodoferax aquiterrae]|uniref:PAS domain S-box-containing protein/diguanylate cyclase (GGDEF)-like protein n=1 Tax=Pseudorhodoferax aquiterrae TaxID=747304 RepID=A0ABQ3G803_9BURK|nr:bifunctional diguanylate cyclase/phosphodiesterase [Pseudorhodoferax aquiterrae]GHC93853.1 hypothetical protein GCM10007320_45140 [Pseudorhodoferax aquiterrae]
MKAEERDRLQAPVDLVNARKRAALIAMTAVTAGFLILQGPGFGMAPGWVGLAHLLLELAAVGMAVQVISTAWGGLSYSASTRANLFIAGFGIVAGADLLHALVHESLATPVLQADEAAATWFWVVGRVVQVAVMGLVLLRVRLPGPRALWLQTAVLVACVLGLSASAVVSRWAADSADAVAAIACVASWAAAAGCYRRFARTADPCDLWLVLSCFLLGAALFVAGLYGQAPGRADLVADLLRLGSYLCLHRAVFLNGFDGPLRRLVHSETALRDREAELKNILENLPVGLCRLDRYLQFRYANGRFRKIMGADTSEMPGQSLDTLLSAEQAEVLALPLERALSGDRIEFDFSTVGALGERPQHRHAVLAPARLDDGGIGGVLAIVSDVSDREHARQRAAETAQEIQDLRAALDAHAIVAVTDGRGVITRVNDKFCSISRYPREELVGKTHRIINSGHHPKGFFGEMWKTISRGEVWNGEVCNRTKDGALYWVHTTIVPLLGAQGVPVQYIAIRADITKRKEAEAQAQRMALHDALTGLPNRRLMGDRLQHAVLAAEREGQCGALLILDMDNFKDVNDSLGHAAGDQLLQQVATRLGDGVRKSDTVSRLGGDEFVVILERLGPGLQDATAKALDIGMKICEELGRPFCCAGNTINTSTSIGVVLFHGQGDVPDELVKQADMALYKAKEEGRNRVAFFDPDLQSEINARAELLRELRNALARQELRLYYQPVVDASLRIVGVEALLRWQQDRLGLVSPAQFIPLAEQSGLIISIGEWVLQEACRQLKVWEDDPVRQHWTVAVNVSAKQFHDEQFIGRVLRILEASGAAPHKLRLEITESMMQVNLEQTVVTMQTLKALGVLFSLDDFGTGYSSLSYLKKLPLDQLKIDRSFVADIMDDPNDAAIVRTVISLAEHLSLTVVAEGVESLEQKQFLVRHGCTAFQGFLFGRPVPAELLGEQLPSVQVAQAALDKARR